MRLLTIIRQARNGELKGLSAKDKTDEVIVDYVNLALIELYGRFQLNTEEAILALQSTKTLYKLDGTDADVTVNGIPLEEDSVMQITEVFDENGPVGLNDDNDPLGVYTASYDSIQVPNALDDSYISVIYKKTPELATYADDGEGNAVDTEVRITPQLLVPMLHYIGYRAHGSLDGNIQAENNTHLMRFEASCKKAEALGIVPMDHYSRDVSLKGFV